jgi:hypothetical protein
VCAEFLPYPTHTIESAWPLSRRQTNEVKGPVRAGPGTATALLVVPCRRTPLRWIVAFPVQCASP